MRKFVFTLVAFLYILQIQGQNRSYRNYNYKWTEAHPVRLSVNPEFADEPAVILDEKTVIETVEDKFYKGMTNKERGDTAKSISSFNYRYNYFVEKQMRIRYQSMEGIQKFSRFALPETFDPQGSNAGLTLEQQKTMHRPKGDYDLMVYFAARIIKPDGSFVEAQIRDSSEIEEFSVYPTDRNYQTSPIRLKKHYAVHHIIDNISVGDEVEIHYAVRHVFMPSRFFFNGTLPKQKVDFTLKTDIRGHIYFVNQFNGAAFKDSLNKGNLITYKWSFTNLPGCMTEKGARPYLELPYIDMHLNDMNYGILDEKGTLVKALPYTWGTVMVDFAGYEHPIPKDVVYNDLAKVNIKLRDWINEKTAGIIDTNWAVKAKVLHEDVVDNWKYQQDDAYFKNEDNVPENLAKFIEQRTLREISRIRFYTRALEKINASYYKVLLLDKRVESMDYDKFQFPTTYKIAFAITYRNSAVFVLPKEDRYGWYVNELPFYYEDIVTSLVPQDIPADDAFKQLPEITFINVKTPFSDVANNQRTTNVMVSFHPDTGRVLFDAKVILKGQFSTMTRGSYLYNYKDKTSNPLYHQLVWQLQDDVEKPQINITLQEKKYPFEFDFRTNYQSGKILLKNKSGSHFISLKNWFPHITDSGLNSEQRQLSYFPDFTGSDNYRYFIKCGKPVNIVNADAFEKNIENHAGSYLCRISQPQPDVIMIESTLIIKEEIVRPDKINGLEEIYDAARKLNSGFLEVKYN